jgi:hypothetical protein
LQPAPDDRARSASVLFGLPRLLDVGAVPVVEQHPMMNAAAPDHLPPFVTAPGGSDWLMTVMLVFLIVTVVSVGLIYLRLHALPEHMAHRTNKVQLQIVAVLALLALFTHNHVFWIAALLLALIDLPDFSTPMNSIALSLERLSGRDRADPAAAARWNDLLSDDQAASLPAEAGPAGKEA